MYVPHLSLIGENVGAINNINETLKETICSMVVGTHDMDYRDIHIMLDRLSREVWQAQQRCRRAMTCASNI